MKKLHKFYFHTQTFTSFGGAETEGNISSCGYFHFVFIVLLHIRAKSGCSAVFPWLVNVSCEPFAQWHRNRQFSAYPYVTLELHFH